MELGLIGLGKMGGNMRERLRRAGHTVIGYDHNPDVSDVKDLEQLEAQVKGEGVTTGFNPTYLLDGLTALDHPVVELAFTQASKPAVITGVDGPEGEPNTDFRYLLMPRRLLS